MVLSPNERIDQEASRLWLEAKSMARFTHAHPLRDEVSRRLFEHLQAMILNPKDWMAWRPLSGGSRSMRELSLRFPKSRGHFWQESPLARQVVLEAQKPQSLRQWSKRFLSLSRSNQAQPLLDFTPDSMDLIWSHLGLHNEFDPIEVFKTWARLLRPQGVAVFSCWGPDTLKELRSLYASLGWPQAMHPLVDMHDWGDLLVQNGLSDPVMDMEYVSLTYDKVDVLLSDLRLLGRNLNPARLGSLRTPSWLKVLRVALEQERLKAGGRLTLSFEIIYGHAFKASPKALMAKEVQVSLHDMKAQLKNRPVR